MAMVVFRACESVHAALSVIYQTVIGIGFTDCLEITFVPLKESSDPQLEHTGLDEPSNFNPFTSQLDKMSCRCACIESCKERGCRATNTTDY